MIEVRVESDFAAAHFLQDYHGKCENLHGHNYKVYVHAKGNEIDAGGMLLDFGVLKNSLRNVCKILDHTNLNDLQENGKSVFNQNPSAERIAKFIFDKVKEDLSNSGWNKHSEFVYAVDVFETPTSRARYYQ